MAKVCLSPLPAQVFFQLYVVIRLPICPVHLAAPHVAGVAALILQRNPDLTADSVRSILAHSADKIGPYKYNKDSTKVYGTWNEYYGYGLVNAANAVKRTPRKE